MIARINKYSRVLKEMIKLRIHGLMIFRLDFFSPFFIDGSLFVVQLLTFEAVYSNIDSIGSWGRGGNDYLHRHIFIVKCIEYDNIFFRGNQYTEKNSKW